MTKIWQAQEAKARFSAFLEASLKDGPQIVTRRGVETAVLVPIAEWRRLERSARPSLKDLLLAPEPRTESLTPPRERHRHRSTPVLD
ncbi:MAG: type II toxin-antitoxin system Phd/YefM family antitoxin [Hyphomicrobiales bacterium]|nr:type II toxin-antitoxin system Phd/YefM family antitoxin [Hyphomicrobiales bacterium]